MIRKTIVCTYCGSENIWADANAHFNYQTQEWDLGETMPDYFCEQCDGMCSVKDVYDKEHTEDIPPFNPPAIPDDHNCPSCKQLKELREEMKYESDKFWGEGEVITAGDKKLKDMMEAPKTDYCSECKQDSVFEVNTDQDPVFVDGLRLRECIKCGRLENWSAKHDRS